MTTLQLYIGAAAHLVQQAHSLPASEQEHAHALGLDAGSERALAYASGRVLLRQMLASTLGCLPEDVPLDKVPSGKLVCRALMGGKPVHVSLSHTAVPMSAAGPAEVYVACSLSQACSNGVDIEWSLRQPRWRATAKRRFHASEWEDLESAGGSIGRQAFLRLWCLKEARVKAEDGQLLDSLARPVSSARVRDVVWPAGEQAVTAQVHCGAPADVHAAQLGAQEGAEGGMPMQFAAFSLPLSPRGEGGGAALIGAAAAQTDENLTLQLTSFL